jgi:Replication initiator protein A
MEEGSEPTEKGTDLEGEVRTALQAASSKLPSNAFVKVENNLASLGFFTPSSKRTRNEKAKTVSVTVMIDGKRIEAKATIAPTALFGLPITADQDKWLALHNILEDIQARDGQVTNPVCFSSAELLAILKIYKNSGKNYRDVSDWLDVMVGTTIVSEGAVYFAGKRTFGKDTFHVFDRAVSFGKQLPDGSISDKNYVWLSQWQLQNINDHHQLPIDLDTYRQLRNHIAKALVPLLQIWLYATRDDGVFEKRYAELCQILDIRQWTYPSKIKEKLGPSLDELKQFGYLADWRIELTSDQQGYKVLFFHGEKFHSDRRARQSRKQLANRSPGAISESVQYTGQIDRDDHGKLNPARTAYATTPVVRHFDPVLVSELTRRGITENRAHELLADLKPGQDKQLVRQLQHAEHLVEQSQIPITNPAGFIIRLIEYNTPVPDGFETKAERTTRLERERGEGERRALKEARQQLAWEYDEYRDTETDRYIQANAPAFESLKDAKREEDRGRFSFNTESTARVAARFEIQKEITFLTFDEFLERKKQGTDLFLKPVEPSPATEPATTEQDAQIGAAEVEVEMPSDDAAPDMQAETVMDPLFPQVEPIAEVVPPDDLLEADEIREANMQKPTSGKAGENAPIQSASESPLPEPMMIELVSDPPPNEFGGAGAEQGTA